MLDRLEFIHNKNIIHRDIKPDNFVMGSGNKSHIVYILDNETTGMNLNKLANYQFYEIPLHFITNYWWLSFLLFYGSYF